MEEKLKQLLEFIDSRIELAQESFDFNNKRHQGINPNDYSNANMTRLEERRIAMEPVTRELMAYEGVRRELYNLFPDLNPKKE